MIEQSHGKTFSAAVDRSSNSLSEEIALLRAALQRISDSRHNKNWRKPELCDEADHALARCLHAVPQSPLRRGDALTDCGPDFRVVPVRVLQSAYDRIDAMLANIEPDLRAANSVRIELRHLINETHAGSSPLTRPHQP